MLLFLKIILILIVLFAILCLIVSAFDARRFVVRHYDIKSPKLKKNLRICQLSDVHGWVYGDDNDTLIKAIDEQKPDIILLSGDIFTASIPWETWPKEKTLLKTIASRYPVYAANGNHESQMRWYDDDPKYARVYENYIRDMKSFGIRLLNNESTDLDEYGIHLTGLEFGHYCFQRLYKHRIGTDYIPNLVSSPDPDRFNLMIAHNPQYFEEYAAWGADLTVSGHIHGGIIRLPFLGGVISPALILFPKYDGGMFHIGEKTLVLSRGLGTHTVPVRVFNPGELVVIDLKAEKSE